jgi:hypothetical protein
MAAPTLCRDQGWHGAGGIAMAGQHLTGARMQGAQPRLCRLLRFLTGGKGDGDGQAGRNSQRIDLAA